MAPTEQRRLRGRRHGQLRRDGLALHGERLPHAVHLRRAVPAARSTIGPSATTIWSRSTRKPSGRSASPATCSTILPRAAPAAAAHAAAPAQPRIRNPEARRAALGLHPFDIPMLRNSVPYNGRAAVHALPLVRGVRLRSRRQERHAEHRDSHRPGHRHCANCAPGAWSRRF